METPETTDVESTTPITSPTTDNPVSTSSANPFTPTVSLQPKNCRYVGFQTSPGRRRRFNRWCRWNCNRGYCPSSLCRCDSEATDSIMCYSIGIYRRMVGMSGWCNNNCKRQYCPRNMCKCKRVWDLNAIFWFQLIWSLRSKFYRLVSNVMKFEISTLSFGFNSNVLGLSISMFSVLHTSICFVLLYWFFFEFLIKVIHLVQFIYNTTAHWIGTSLTLSLLLKCLYPARKVSGHAFLLWESILPRSTIFILFILQRLVKYIILSVVVLFLWRRLSQAI